MEKQYINKYIKTTNISLNQVHPINEYSLYFDGCSKGNPGPAGIGAVIYKKEIEISVCSKNIGHKTNNEAEYCALILGLEEAIRLNIKSLCVYGDSLLVINQVNKTYKVKNEKIFTLYEKVVGLKREFNNIIFTHIYRTNNKRADQLSNFGLTKHIYNNDLYQEKEDNLYQEKEDNLYDEKEDNLYDEKEDDFIKVLDIDWKEEPCVKKDKSYIKQIKINSFFPPIKKVKI